MIRRLAVAILTLTIGVACAEGQETLLGSPYPEAEAATVSQGSPATEAVEEDKTWAKVLGKDDRRDLAFWDLGTAALGKAKGVFKSSFDVYRDTPNFRNFALGDGEGTCAGMCYVVKNVHMYADFRSGRPAGGDLLGDALERIFFGRGARFTFYGATDLRDLCASNPDMPQRLQVLMGEKQRRLGTLGNRLRIASTLLGLWNDATTVYLAAERADRDGVTTVGFVSVERETGHAVLVHRVLLFEKGALLYVYDPNFLYTRKHENRNRTMLYWDFDRNRLCLFPASYAAMYGPMDYFFCLEGFGEASFTHARDAVAAGISNMGRAGTRRTERILRALVALLWL